MLFVGQRLVCFRERRRFADRVIVLIWQCCDSYTWQWLCVQMIVDGVKIAVDGVGLAVHCVRLAVNGFRLSVGGVRAPVG